MAMRCLLYKKKDKIVIFDAGVGIKPDKRLAPYGFFQQKDLKQLLLEKGITPVQVTDVVLSHLHFDHCGGITACNAHGNPEAIFPNATYHISKVQWEHHLHPGYLDADAYFNENSAFLKNNPRLNLIETDIRITPEIELMLFDGHTPGQLVSFIHTNDDCFVFAADVVPLALNLHIDSISAFDLQAEITACERIRLLKKVVDLKATLIYYHDAYTSLSKVKKTGRGFRPIPAPALPNVPNAKNQAEPSVLESNSNNEAMP